MDGNEDDEKALQRRVQGEGGDGSDPGRSDAGGTGSEAWYPPHDDRGMEAPGDGWDGQPVR